MPTYVTHTYAYPQYSNLVEVVFEGDALTPRELRGVKRPMEVARQVIAELGLPEGTTVDWRDPCTLWLWLP